MNRVVKIIIILICILIIIGSAWWYINKKNKKIEISEYEPEEEISQAQERETLISLYFKSKNTGEIEPEARLMDVKELVKEPYKTLMNLLMEGPKNNNFETLIPEGTKINKMNLNNDTLIIDFSKEFIEKHKGAKEAEKETVDSIVKTMTELTEVNSIKILIDGEENKAFLDNQITFENEFAREE